MVAGYVRVHACLCRKGMCVQGLPLIFNEMPDGGGVSRRSGHQARGGTGYPRAQAFREEASWWSLRPGAPLWVKPSLHPPSIISFLGGPSSVPKAFIASECRSSGKQANQPVTGSHDVQYSMHCAESAARLAVHT